MTEFIELFNLKLVLVCSSGTLICWAAYKCVECKRRARNTRKKLFEHFEALQAKKVTN